MDRKYQKAYRAVLSSMQTVSKDELLNDEQTNGQTDRQTNRLI